MIPEAHFGWLDWTVFASYLGAIVLVGAYFSKRQNSTDEFFTASKRMHWLPVSLSIVASLFSGISFIGQPSRVYRYDSVIFAYAISVLLVTPIVMYVLIPFYRRLDVTTAYEYLERRFSLNVRLLASSLFILKRLFWMGLVALAPSLALTTITGLRVEYCILLIGVVATIYTGLGGMSAVIWTDAAQFVILTLGQVLMIWFIASKLDGGFAEIWEVGRESGKVWMSMEFTFVDLTFWSMLIAGCVFALSDLGVDQVTVQRLMTTPDEKTAQRSMIFNALFKFPGMMVLLGIGVALYAYYQAFPELLTLGEDQIDQVVPFFVVTELPAGISGFVIAAIFAAAMSSFDSGLNCMVTAFTVDWYKRLYKSDLEDREYLKLAKLLTFVLGGLITLMSILIYQAGVKSIIDKSNKYLGFFGGALLGIFLLGMLTRRAKPLPTVIGAVASVALVILLDLWQEENGAFVHNYMYGLISMVITMAVGYFGSLLGRETPYETIQDFTMAKKK